MSEKQMIAKRYFIFKFIEYVHNKFKAIQNKRNDSITLLIGETIDLFEEYYECRNEKTRDQMKVALKRFKAILTFHIERNPFLQDSSLSNDLKYLSKIINSENVETSEQLVYFSLVSLNKKLNALDIIRMHIDIVLAKEYTFAEMDRILESFVDELITKGYSLRYLKEWYKSSILDNPFLLRANVNEPESIDGLLNEFLKLSGDKRNFNVFLFVDLPESYVQKLNDHGVLNVGNCLVFKQVSGEELSLFEENALKDKFPNNYKNTKSIFVKTEVASFDEYKAVQDAVDSFSRYFELCSFMINVQNIIGKSCVLYDCESTEYRILKTDGLAQRQFTKKLDSKEGRRIEDYIAIRNELIDKNEDYTKIAIIERSLEILISSSKLSNESILHSMWTVLELLVSEYEGHSIIEKVTTIVPKSICLYSLKEKLNTFWDRVNEKKDRPYFQSRPIKNFIDRCENKSDPEKYINAELIKYLADEAASKELYDAFSLNINIQRAICEINYLLIKKDKKNRTVLKEHLTSLHDEVVHDLNRIYRIRNKIIHQGNHSMENLETVIERLLRYVNGLLLDYITSIKFNPELSTAEILHSTINTYNWHINLIDSTEINIVKHAIPERLFIR